MEGSFFGGFVRALGRRLITLVGAIGLTVLFFGVLPVIQAITTQPEGDTIITEVDTAALPPPPPPPVEEPEEEEPEEEPPPPPMEPEPQLLDLAQLDLALNPGMGDGWMGADFALELNTLGGGGGDGEDSIFSLADLDQEPRLTNPVTPKQSAKTRKAAPGTVYIIFVVNESGRVQDARVQKSTNPVFDAPALAAVKKWRFEPGKREGKPVSFRMRVPVTFPKG